MECASTSVSSPLSSSVSTQTTADLSAQSPRQSELESNVILYPRKQILKKKVISEEKYLTLKYFWQYGYTFLSDKLNLNKFILEFEEKNLKACVCLSEVEVKIFLKCAYHKILARNNFGWGWGGKYIWVCVFSEKTYSNKFLRCIIIITSGSGGGA